MIDSFDSFTYNLHHYVSSFNLSCDVLRSNNIEDIDINRYKKVILSPGPSLPCDYPEISKFLEKYADSVPILGVCLGFQFLVEFFGGSLVNLDNVKHGVSSRNTIVSSDSLFIDLPEEFQIGHYHSWAASNDDFPECLKVTSVNEEDLIMSFSHKDLDIKGVQFHPESILTPLGKTIINNWVSS